MDTQKNKKDKVVEKKEEKKLSGETWKIREEKSQPQKTNRADLKKHI